MALSKVMRKIEPALLLLLFGSFLFLAPLGHSQSAGALNHSGWDALLKRYVNDQSRVDYQHWKQEGVADLDTYLKQLAEPWPQGIAANEKKAALINAYNVLTVRWILHNYPVRSIWATEDPFAAKRHVVDGHKVSLDEIESQLRGVGDPRIHAALVCAARSCPPLRREAYTGNELDRQLDDSTRVWLANPDLNEFLPEQRLGRISKIFDWYRKDFQGGGSSVQKFLARYAPRDRLVFLKTGQVKIQYKPYNWGLNDTSALGEDYSQPNVIWDRFRNIFRK